MNILSTAAMGTLETVKLMPGYDKAIEFLKKESDKLKKEKENGVKQQDTK